MTITSGLRSGLRVGLRSELNPGGVVDPMAGVTKDGSSNIYCPANASEWTTAMAAAGLATGNPSSVWNCQEASGNLTDAIGSIALTVTGSPTFQQAISGWARKGITYPLSTTARHTNSTTAPSAGSTSLLMLLYALPPSADVGLTRSLCQVGTTAELRCNTSSPTRMTVVNGATTAGAGAFLGTSVRPILLRYNRTATTVTGFSDIEKIVGTYAAATGPIVGFPSNGAQSMGFSALYAALFDGAAAELTDAQVKTLLTQLGWSIPWS